MQYVAKMIILRVATAFVLSPPHALLTARRLLLVRAAPPLCSAELDDPHIELLEAVLSRLPSGAPVLRSQLRSMCGLLANDLCGCALKQLPGSFDRSVVTLLGEQPLRADGGAQPEQPEEAEVGAPGARRADGVVLGSRFREVGTVCGGGA